MTREELYNVDEDERELNEIKDLLRQYFNAKSIKEFLAVQKELKQYI